DHGGCDRAAHGQFHTTIGNRNGDDQQHQQADNGVHLRLQGFAEGRYKAVAEHAGQQRQQHQGNNVLQDRRRIKNDLGATQKADRPGGMHNAQQGAEYGKAKRQGDITTGQIGKGRGGNGTGTGAGNNQAQCNPGLQVQQQGQAKSQDRHQDKLQ